MNKVDDDCVNCVERSRIVVNDRIDSVVNVSMQAEDKSIIVIIKYVSFNDMNISFNVFVWDIFSLSYNVFFCCLKQL